jgi:hypothetical protein
MAIAKILKPIRTLIASHHSQNPIAYSHIKQRSPLTTQNPIT